MRPEAWQLPAMLAAIQTYDESTGAVLTRTVRLPMGRAGTQRTLELIGDEARKGITMPALRALALQIVRAVPGKNFMAEAQAVQAWVRTNVRYVRDPTGSELVQSPALSMRTRQGDCDDHTALVAALLGSVGHSVRATAIAPKIAGQFAHVYAESFLNGAWRSVETTEPWPVGYVPTMFDRMSVNVAINPAHPGALAGLKKITKSVKKVAKPITKIAKPITKPLTKIVKPFAPIIASAVGTVYGGPAGGAAAGKLTSSLVGKGRAIKKIAKPVLIKAKPLAKGFKKISKPLGRVATMALPIIGGTIAAPLDTVGIDVENAAAPLTSAPAVSWLDRPELPGAAGELINFFGNRAADKRQAKQARRDLAVRGDSPYVLRPQIEAPSDATFFPQIGNGRGGPLAPSMPDAPKAPFNAAEFFENNKTAVVIGGAGLALTLLMRMM